MCINCNRLTKSEYDLFLYMKYLLTSIQNPFLPQKNLLNLWKYFISLQMLFCSKKLTLNASIKAFGVKDKYNLKNTHI